MQVPKSLRRSSEIFKAASVVYNSLGHLYYHFLCMNAQQLEGINTLLSKDFL